MNEIAEKLTGLARPLARPQIFARATAFRHASMTILLHWSTVLAIVLAVAAIWYRDYADDKQLRVFLLGAHRQLGLAVLLFVPLRILVRWRLGFADQSAGMAFILRWCASMCHAALYAVLLILPLAGWAATSAKGIKLSLFGLFTLPSLMTKDPDIADQFLNYHVWGAWLLLVVVVAHALAAFGHHFLMRDGVLRAMLPGKRR
jgi:cytochrome b561